MMRWCNLLHPSVLMKSYHLYLRYLYGRCLSGVIKTAADMDFYICRHTTPPPLTSILAGDHEDSQNSYQKKFHIGIVIHDDGGLAYQWKVPACMIPLRPMSS